MGLPVLAAATAWLALPAPPGCDQQGRHDRGRGVGRICRPVEGGGIAALGKSEADLGFGALPDAAQVVGIVLAFEDQRKPTT
jgi:hypothetical protein